MTDGMEAAAPSCLLGLHLPGISGRLCTVCDHRYDENFVQRNEVGPTLSRRMLTRSDIKVAAKGVLFRAPMPATSPFARKEIRFDDQEHPSAAFDKHIYL